VTQQLDHLKRVFPIRQLFRGASLRALLWSLFGTGCFAALLLTIFLIVALLDSQGRLSVSASSRKEYEFFFEPQTKSTEGIVEENLSPLQMSDVGLKAVGWQFRHRPLGNLISSLCRRNRSLHTTGTALFYLIAYALVFGFALNAIVARVQMLTTRIADKAAGQLRESLHRHALRTGISDLKNEQTATIIELFTLEVDRIRVGIEQWIKVLFRFPARILVLLIVGMMINGLVIFQCAVPLIALWYLIRRENRHSERAQRLQADRASMELKLLTEGVRNSRLVRGFGLEDFEHGRFERHLSRYQERIGDVERRQSKTAWLTRSVAFGCFGVVFYLVGMRMTIDPTEPQYLSLADATLLLTVFVLGYAPLEGLANLKKQRADAALAAEKVYRYLNEIPVVGQAVGAKFLEPIQKSLEFKGITYRHGKRTILDGVNLKIEAGATTAIISFNEIERQALVSMVPRFLEPNEGKVLIDGEDISWATLESLRTEALFVSADNAAFTGTVLENISGNEERYSLSNVTEAAKTSHAHNFIQKLPQGYETVIGEHGEQLNVSEAFRLSMARAILRNPAMLIIEEPSGELSDDEKALIEDGYRRVSEKRTILVLANRLATLRNADRIIMLNKGQVEAMGSHEALVKKSALYQHWEYIKFNEFRRNTGSLEE
jgi:ATP-binding cassette, subfamily B, bacterial